MKHRQLGRQQSVETWRLSISLSPSLSLSLSLSLFSLSLSLSLLFLSLSLTLLLLVVLLLVLVLLPFLLFLLVFLLVLFLFLSLSLSALSLALRHLLHKRPQCLGAADVSQTPSSEMLLRPEVKHTQAHAVLPTPAPPCGAALAANRMDSGQ